MTEPFPQSDGPRLTLIGKLFIFLFVVAMIGVAFYLFAHRAGFGLGNNSKNPTAANGDQPTQATQPNTPAGGVEIGIAYGTEKRRWLEGAVAEFAKTQPGARIRINLIPMGSLEGARAILKDDKRIHVWSPAGSLYAETFIADAQLKFNVNPIARQENLALTPMVFIMWEERYNAFMKRYKAVNFQTISQALQEPGGWAGIAQKEEWGLFKFGHTHPNESSSGLSTLMLMAYTYQHKNKNLSMADILNTDFQTWLKTTEAATSGRIHSTGTMVRDMVLKGPSSYDAVFAYEATAIDFLQSAEGRWGKLRVIYPQFNLWNESPYYVLNVPWSSDAQKQAAGVFLDFLLSEPIQKASITHGFRPANPAVSTRGADSPFVTYQSVGISDNLGTICEPPRADVMNNLLQYWERIEGGR